jgi:alpha-N-acetylglucosaminidase
MKKRILHLLLAIMAIGLSLTGNASDFKKAAEALIARVIPDRAKNMIVQIIPSENAKDVFEIESINNKIILRGNNGISVASALNWYLKYYAHCQVSWNSDNIKLPKVLPTVSPKVRILTSYAHRVYLNYCTFSYTMPWWDWKRWEREIDWMAMHGINMPLAITGQEVVWQATLRKFKMSDEEINAFLVGPAYFAWQFMTNIEGWGGPLPQHWIDTHIQLGQQIVARERELGMTPILQGFTGYVPRLLKDKYPNANIKVKGDWFGVPPGSGQLDPLDPLFAQIGKSFLEEQTRLFGTDHYYAADPFHEGAPPVDGDEYLKKVGEAIYHVTSSVDPQAMIAMQTWSLREPIVKAIPENKILLLDLAGRKWETNEGFWGRPWVAGILHNYGGRVFMGGNLPVYAANAPALLTNPKAGNLQGIGLFPEAIEHNPVVYELGSELAWLIQPPELTSWIQNYALARYGSLPPEAAEAWQLLQQTVYGQKISEPSMESVICARPSLTVTKVAPNGSLRRDYNPAALWKAWNALLSARQLHNIKTYQFDLVDVARQCLADLSLPLQQNITKAYLSGNKAELKKAADTFLSLIDDFDGLLSTRSEYLLGKWIADARRWGTTEAEKNLYEKNARTLITTWGPVQSNAVQYDYSNRQWAGLVSGYYKPRWQKFLNYLMQQPDNSARFMQEGLQMSYGRPSYTANDFYKNLATWEKAWTNSHEKYAATPKGNPVTIAAKLYRKWLPISNKVYQ